MRETTFTIAGMHCDGCAENIQDLLESQDGVRMATVSLREKRACVLYDDQAIEEESVVAIIEKPSFRVVDRR